MSVVFTHDYAVDELDAAALEILQVETEIRTGPGTSAPWRHETCIGIYGSKHNSFVDVIGSVDPAPLMAGRSPLTFEVGDSADGGWPWCGSVKRSLGSEAVHEWRAVHDRVRWLADIEAATRSHEEMLLRLKEEDRQKRQAAKTRRRDR